MALETTLPRLDRFVYQTAAEYEQANKTPIGGYEDEEIVPLENAVVKLIPLINNVQKYVHTAKAKCRHNSNLLDHDESAAIYLYTMQTTFFSDLNKKLRAECRPALKPWFSFLKLFMTALHKLPSSNTTVWRAVSGNTEIFSGEDNTQTWWSINSTSLALNVVEFYLGDNGTVFAIHSINGKNISEYSAFPQEQEVILMPGTCVQLKSKLANPVNHLVIVHLQEVTIEQNTPSNNTTTSSCIYQPSVDNSDDSHTNDVNQSTHLLFENSLIIRNQSRQPKIITQALLILSVCVIVMTTFILFTIFLIKNRYSSPTHTNKDITTSTETHMLLSEKPITNNDLSPVFCTHRDFHITADILYSFDCSNTTDDLSGIYNGIPAIPSWIPYDSTAARTIVPKYVTPDYSGQGAALKIDSSIKYQYIKLIRSPIFFNQTFTISVWLNPNIQPSIVYVIFSQLYVDAPDLALSIIDQYVVLRVYRTLLWSKTKLKNFYWQYVTCAFSPDDLSMAIFIDGIADAHGGIADPEYGNFDIRETIIGSYSDFNQYNGLIDQLLIAFRIKSRSNTLDEATLVVHYTFEGEDQYNDFLFQDSSVNSIRARGSNVSYLSSSRRVNQKTLLLDNPNLSYFQSGGFLLLSTHNYSYSYAVWLHLSSSSLFVPLIHLVTTANWSPTGNNTNTCLSMLVMNRIDENNFQLSLHIYGLDNTTIITSSKLIPYSNWFHVALVSGRNSTSLYVNGTLVTSFDDTNGSAFQINNQQRVTMTIGDPEVSVNEHDLYSALCDTNKNRSQSNQTTIGVDELRFYSRELKRAEIQALANDEFIPTRFFFS